MGEIYHIVYTYKMPVLPEKLLTSIIILIAAFLLRIFAFAVLKASINKIEDDDPATNTALEQRAHTLGNIIKGTLNIAIYGIAFITIMSEWGINVAPLLTGAGIMGLAVGFGAQSLAKDLINGFFILLENQFNIGDRIKIAGIEGRVVKISLRNVILETADGKTHSVPNSKVEVITKL